MMYGLILDQIGIRFGGNHQRSCTVVLTTRRKDVCILMECQKIIQLELLEKDEAWTLFESHANVGDTANEDVARAIAMECAGLPIAIVAVGSCLKGKGIDEMKEMLFRLRNAEPINVDEGVMSAFDCLNLSYDYLKTPEAKKLLLMCAMFPEDHDIDVEDLFRYGMGLGLYRGVYSFEIARSKVRTAVNHLIDSSLLMSSSPKLNDVIMHDVVRDFALWKASDEDRTIMVDCTEELEKLIDAETVNNCYAFSSWYSNNRLLQFLSQFHAPKLEFLLLHSSELLDISHATLEGTEGLKALIIMYTRPWAKIELQPQSIQHLSNLQTLRLQNWNLRDISFVKLQQLECYQLGNEEYKPLALIERVELANIGVESIFHYQIGLQEQIPAFQCLKELILEKCARLKFVFSAQICHNLPELTSVTISCCEELEAIFLGNEETLINLCITESCMLKLKSLEISKCNKLKFVLSFMISAATSMLPQLCTLTVSDCSQMEEILKCSNIEDHDTDSEREIKFPNMRHMELYNLPLLVNICQGFKLNIGGFRLRTGESCKVKVDGCPKLMPIRSAIARCTEERLVREYELKYSQLNNKEALNLPLSVLNVGGLDIQSPRVEDHHWRIIGDDEQEETDNSEILRLEQQMVGGVVPTQLLSFQYLYSLQVIGTKKFKFLFSMSTIVQNSLPKLTSLTLSDCEELEVIFGHSGDDDANYGDIIVLSSLKEIELRNLPNFKSVCLVGLQIQVELTDIDICNCSNFVVSSLGSALQQLGTLSVSTEDSNVETSSNVNEEKGKVLISRAVRLWLKDSMNLISVWEGRTFIKFENLALLHVTKCRRLKCIFPSTVMRSLPCLWYLRIEECEELEEIMSSGEEEHNHFPNESSNNSFCFPQLKSLIVERCRTLKWLFPSLPSTQRLPMLFQLEIEECSELKGLCNSEVEIHEEGFYNNSLPNLMRLTVEDCLVFSKTTLAALQSCKRRNIRYY